MAQLSTTPSLLNDANLLAYYKLEDVNDSKASFNLTNNGTVVFNSAKYGNGADFGSANSSKYLSIANDLGITGGACSFSFWIKLSSEIASGEWVFFIQADAGTNVAFFVRYAYNAGSQQLQYARRKTGGADTVITIAGALGTTAWHHIVLTYDGATLSNYKNGVVSENVAVTGNGVSGAADGFQIGATQVPDSYTSAIIDDFSIFSRALTATEVLTLYNDPGGSFIFNLI